MGSIPIICSKKAEALTYMVRSLGSFYAKKKPSREEKRSEAVCVQSTKKDRFNLACQPKGVRYFAQQGHGKKAQPVAALLSAAGAADSALVSVLAKRASSMTAVRFNSHALFSKTNSQVLCCI